MSARKTLPKSLRKSQSKSITLILRKNHVVGYNADKLDSVGVDRIAAALTEGYNKRQICDHLGINKTVYNKWYLTLTPDEKMLIHLASIDKYTDIQEDTLNKILNNLGVNATLPDAKTKKDKEGDQDSNVFDSANHKIRVQSTNHNQLMQVYNILERKIASEHARKPETNSGGTIINQNNIILASGNGAFQPPPANRVIDQQSE